MKLTSLYIQKAQYDRNGKVALTLAVREKRKVVCSVFLKGEIIAYSIDREPIRDPRGSLDGFARFIPGPADARISFRWDEISYKVGRRKKTTLKPDPKRKRRNG